jgi:hypothetical protein
MYLKIANCIGFVYLAAELNQPWLYLPAFLNALGVLWE